MSTVRGKISGPISAHYTYYDGIKFNFFGDAHLSKEGKCDPCNEEDNCYSITDVLKQNFSYADEKQLYIDFFLEMPFRSKTLKKSPFSEDIDFISQIKNTFEKCITKESCPYKNTRFHYIDIRQAAWSTHSLWGIIRLDYNRIVNFPLSCTHILAST